MRLQVAACDKGAQQTFAHVGLHLRSSSLVDLCRVKNNALRCRLCIWTDIMSNFQHAGDWDSIYNVVKGLLDPLIKANYKDKFGAAVG
jgi:hypothetical protein